MSFLGGAQARTLSTTVTLSALSARIQHINATSAGAVLKMFPATARQEGGVYFYIINDSASTNSVTLKDNAGTTIGTVAPGDWAKIHLVNNESAAGLWFVRTGTQNTARTIYQASRPAPDTLGVLCPNAMAKYMLVRCNNMFHVIYSSDPVFETHVGKVVKLTLSPSGAACWFVHRVRLSEVTPEGPSSAILASYDSCKECNSTMGMGIDNDDTWGDADDSGIEPSERIRKNYDGSDSGKVIISP